MLQKLSIRNYALINELEISFSKGLTIITGETGAGKSILLGALALLLGNRADSASLSDKTKKCIVEGEFDVSSYKLEKFFIEHDLDFESKTTIRREISPEGKSRAFINDTPVNLAALKELGSRLIDIHSQHETLTLNNSSFQLMVVDSFAASGKLLASFRSDYNFYSVQADKLRLLKEQESKSKADLDYYQFLFNELNEAALKAGEQQELEKELEILNNSEEIKTALASASAMLDGDENSLLSGITSVLSALQNAAKIFPEAGDVLNRVKSVSIELKDISSELDSLQLNVQFSPERIEIINDRLDLIYKLEQKHRVNSVEELIVVYNDIDSKLTGISSLEEEIQKLEKSVALLRIELFKKAAEISTLRKKAIPGIEKSIQKMLSDVGMKHAVLKVDLKPVPGGEIRVTGYDQVQLLFSANKGIDYRELDKVASGGELSRLMLCIKALIAKHADLPTIIFDEIDTGVSGEIAHKVGNIVKDISKERQVIAITHLPQMAGKGEEHLFVYKETGPKITSTRIRKLSTPERVDEIAKMLSGEQPTKAAIENARELLEI